MNRILPFKHKTRISNPSLISLLENGNHPPHTSHFNQIISHAITSGLFTDPFISSKLLLCSLSYSQNLTFSRTLFFQIQNPNLFSWNFMFKAFSHSQYPAECISLYHLMRRRGFLPDNYTFPFVLKACGRLDDSKKAQEVHSLSIKLGFQCDVFVQNALISVYSLCVMVEMAFRAFDALPNLVRDVVSWNSMISGYLENHCNAEALKVFGELLEDGSVKPDEFTLVGAFTACARMGFVHVGRKIHGLLLKIGIDLNAFLGSSLIDMYGKYGQMEDAHKVFDRIPDRNVVCWTAMISGYTHLCMFKEAIQMFRDMQLGGVKADAATAACVISACGHSGALDQGRWVHTFCERNGIQMNLSVRNALIDMYSKCGDIQRALQIFHELTQRDVFSWTAMISGLGLNGESDKALLLFSEMQLLSDARPNEVTFLGVLSACSHGGYVDKGFYYFNVMTCTYNLTPLIEHYGCLVDLLGRANLLIEAENLIRILPVQPDVVTWRSLLFACRSHGNVELAVFAADKIEELEPRKGGSNVLLSNIYASVTRWRDATRVRKGMFVQRIQKHPGCSFVEINGCTHEFFAADVSHRQADVIYQTIAGINKFVHSDNPTEIILDYQ